ncbi:MAG: molybdenum cofactor guanylyltransferase MobA [Rugosibacter sp.]|nr:molybdenum cofactor guanylyltransferase [Rugosibacter sp.]
MNTEQITGVILAGGQGLRMGGVDKGLQDFHGRPLVAWAIGHLKPQVHRLLISANRNLERYAAFGYPVLPDQMPDYAGPLAGIHAALTHAQTPWVATVPCDAPNLPHDLIARLVAELNSHDADIAVARTAARAEPLHCLIRRTVLPQLTAYLGDHQRKVLDWQNTLKHCWVDFDAATFRNINTLEELTRHD